MSICLSLQQAWTSPGTWEFTLSGLTLLNSSNGSSGGCNGSNGSSGQRFSLTCRPATSDGLDEQQPFFVGVPSWLALSESNAWGRNYFFARLEPEQQQQQVPFVGDSVEQLTVLQTVKAGSSPAAAAAAAAGPGTDVTNSSNNSSGSNSGLLVLPAAAPAAVEFMWLPRGMAADSSSGSNAPPSPAASSPLSSSKSLGSFLMTPVSSSSSSSGSSAMLPKTHPRAASVVSTGSNDSVGCAGSSGSSLPVSSCVGSLVRGLPIPGARFLRLPPVPVPGKARPLPSSPR